MLRSALIIAVAVLLMATLAVAVRAQVADHLKCYKIKDPVKLAALVDLDSPQFGLEAGCKVKRATMFCVPVTKTVVSAEDKKTRLPITPLSITGPDPGDRICYKVKCAGPPPDTQATDDFGTRTLTKFKPSMLCAPAVKGGAPPIPTPTSIPTPAATPTATPTVPLALVFARSYLTNKLCLSYDAGAFACGDLTPEVSASSAVAVGDLNNDNKLDAVFATADDTANRACLGDGQGGFSCMNIIGDPVGASRSAAVALGDTDGDGKLDAVFGNLLSQRNRVCLGNGAGNFTGCADVSPDIGDTYGVALGDVDDDGRLDAVFARGVARNLVCFGAENGVFGPCDDVGSEMEDSLSVALGDVNNDGKLDVVFANMERVPAAVPATRNRACLSDGNGGFACNEVSPDSDRFSAVALGDVNGDGRLDAVFAVNAQRGNRVCLGDAAGGFSCSDVGDYRNGSHDVELTDVNSDGHLDAVFANEADSYEAQVCFGSGDGSFACAEVAEGMVQARGVAVGQVRW